MLQQLFEGDFPDPSVVETQGYLYLYGTAAHDSAVKNIQVKRAKSFDSSWEDLGGALIGKPEWGKNSKEFWAPSPPIRVDGEYRLYYVTDPDDCRGKGLGIAMAASNKPYDFIPAAHYLISGTDYTVIDPHVVTYAKEQWMFWGSMHQPIRCQKLARNGYEFAKGSKSFEVLRPNHHQFEKMIEGFYLRYHEELKVWFAFVSGNNTWEKDDYAITVYRAVSALGPFERLGVLLRPSEQWWAPGQNSIAVVNGIWYLVCHAVRADDSCFSSEYGSRVKRVACVARLDFIEGCPVVAS